MQTQYMQITPSSVSAEVEGFFLSYIVLRCVYAFIVLILFGRLQHSSVTVITVWYFDFL